MRVCGVQIKGSSALLVVLEPSSAGWALVATSSPKMTLENPDKQTAVKDFADLLDTFFRNHNVSRVAIKARSKRGQYAGGAVSFKIEALLQLCEPEVSLIAAKRVSSHSKKKATAPPPSLLAYQEEAFKTALAFLAEEA